MSNEWKSTTIDSLIEAGNASLQTGPFGTVLKAAEYSSTGVPLISVREIRYGHFAVTEHTPRISKATIERLPKFILHKGDIVFGRKGGIDRNAIVKEEHEGWFLGSDGIRLRMTNDISHSFVSYQMRSPFVQAWLLQNSEGTTMPSLNQNVLGRIPIVVPPLPEQEAIAHILGSLDDKIELNRQMNETLEGMAQALFKSWFVDFDPVIDNAIAAGNEIPDVFKARAAMRREMGYDQRSLSTSIHQQFPNEFECDNELGWIPAGWNKKQIKSVVEDTFDGPHATPKESDEGPIFLGVKNFTKTALDLSIIRKISENDWPKWTRRVTPREQDIVFTYEATLGFFALIPSGLRCCLGRRIALVRPIVENEDAYFLFHTFTASPFQQYLEAHLNYGSTVNRISLSDFPEYPILYPSISLVKLFNQRVESFWKLIHTKKRQEGDLTKIRDTLLPQLLSGTLRIPDAEKLVSEAL